MYRRDASVCGDDRASEEKAKNKQGKVSQKIENLLESKKETEAEGICLSAALEKNKTSAECGKQSEINNSVVDENLCVENDCVGVNTKQTSKNFAEGQYY